MTGTYRDPFGTALLDVKAELLQHAGALEDARLRERLIELASEFETAAARESAETRKLSATRAGLLAESATLARQLVDRGMLPPQSSALDQDAWSRVRISLPIVRKLIRFASQLPAREARLGRVVAAGVARLRLQRKFNTAVCVTIAELERHIPEMRDRLKETATE